MTNEKDAPVAPTSSLSVAPPAERRRSSWKVFVDSTWAFLLREMKNQFGRSRLGYVFAIAEPAAVVAILTALHTFVRGNHAAIYGENPVIFFVFGAVPYFIFMNNVNSAQNVCTSHKGLFNYRQIKPVDIMIARCIIDALMMAAVGFAFLAGWWWLGHELSLDSWLGLVGALTALFALGLSLGLCFEVYGTIYPDLRRVFQIFMRPMFFISGLFFTIDMVPVAYRPLLVWNPVLHGVDFARDAVLTGYDSPGSIVYMLAITAIILFVGLAGYRRHLWQLI